MNSLERDRELWQRWRSGDQAAGSRLMQLYESAVFGLLKRLGVTASDLEDVYGDMLLAVVEYKDRRELDSSFFGLCRRIALSIVLRRRDRDAQLKLQEDLEEPTQSEATSIDFRDALEHCLKAIKKPAERSLFVDRYLGGQDNETLAQRLGKSRNHIAVLIYRSVQHMRDCLSQQGFAPTRT